MNERNLEINEYSATLDDMARIIAKLPKEVFIPAEEREFTDEELEKAMEEMRRVVREFGYPMRDGDAVVLCLITQNSSHYPLLPRLIMLLNQCVEDLLTGRRITNRLFKVVGSIVEDERAEELTNKLRERLGEQTFIHDLAKFIYEEEDEYLKLAALFQYASNMVSYISQTWGIILENLREIQEEMEGYEEDTEEED